MHEGVDGISLAHPPRDHDNHHGSAELEHELAQDKDKNFIPCDRFIRKVRGYEFKTGLKVRARARAAWGLNMVAVRSIIRLRLFVLGLSEGEAVLLREATAAGGFLFGGVGLCSRCVLCRCSSR